MVKLTVALLTYNRPQYLGLAIEAILRQTYSDFEFLILDNGSELETEQIIRKYNDRRIRYIRNPHNSKDFYNSAFYYSAGAYLIITHDDDIMLPELLEKEIKILDNRSEAIAVGCNINYINSRNEIIKQNVLQIDKMKIFSQFEYLPELIIKNGGLPCPTVLMRKSFFLEHNLMFDFSAGPAADNYLWVNANLFPGEMHLLPEPLYLYRIHDQQDSVMNKISMEMQLYESINILLLQNKIDTYQNSIFNRLLKIYILAYKNGILNIHELFAKIKEKGFKTQSKYLAVLYLFSGFFNSMFKRIILRNEM
jgi:glycosyltransferase involved in cell wall biosynthesis